VAYKYAKLLLIPPRNTLNKLIQLILAYASLSCLGLLRNTRRFSAGFDLVYHPLRGFHFSPNWGFLGKTIQDAKI
jgi:hypothetical protein